MRKRWRLMGGWLNLHAQPGDGTKICAWIPFHEGARMSLPRMLIADDHALVLAGLRKLVKGEGHVVGIVEDGHALLATTQKLQPDILLLDISMPPLNGLDAVRQLKKLVPECKLIFLTHATPTYATETFRGGASAYLLKRSAISELRQAIEAVTRRQHDLTPQITKGVFATIVHPLAGKPVQRQPVGTLTPRQREVLQLAAQGKSAKAMASP
ncbi:MAG: response regulator transcription factor [Nitrospira sp.]|nr:response regulator transcription factor [Nitrospira sp.]